MSGKYKDLIISLEKLYDVPNNWDGKSINIWEKGLFNSVDPVYYTLDDKNKDDDNKDDDNKDKATFSFTIYNDTDDNNYVFYFGDMSRTKVNNIVQYEVDINKKQKPRLTFDFDNILGSVVDTNYAYTMRQIPTEHEATVLITEDTITFKKSSFVFMSNKVSDVDGRLLTIFKTGLDKYNVVAQLGGKLKKYLEQKSHH
jgi:hypothetical protein